MGKKPANLLRKPISKSPMYVTLTALSAPKTKRSPRFVSTEEFLHLIDEVTPFTDYVYFHLMGEPLLHPTLKNFSPSAVKEV